MSGHEIYELTALKDYKLNNLAPVKFFSLFAAICVELFKKNEVYIRFKKVTAKEFFRYMINYIKKSPHTNTIIYDAFINTFKYVEGRPNRNVLNSYPFKTHDDDDDEDDDDHRVLG